MHIYVVKFFISSMEIIKTKIKREVTSGVGEKDMWWEMYWGPSGVQVGSVLDLGDDYKMFALLLTQ